MTAKLSKRFLVTYHYTPTRLVPRILQEGLRPHYVPAESFTSSRAKTAMFLAATPELAEWAAANLIEPEHVGFKEPMTLIQVRLPEGTKLIRDVECFGEDVFYTHNLIPSRYLKIVGTRKAGRL